MTTTNDRLHGFSPDEIVVGSGGQTLAQAAVLRLTLADVACAAHAWAAACATSGAMAPGHVATALIAGGDILQAAIDGTAATLAAHREDQRRGWTGPEPRGLEVEIAGGCAWRLVWRSETSLVTLHRSSSGWSVIVECARADHPRFYAAIAGAWRWRDNAPDEAMIRVAATELGLEAVLDDDVEDRS